jgi:hypothetical protein
VARELRWSKLDEETKKLYVRILRGIGLSDERIGDFLSASKGQVVGFRHRRLPDLTGNIVQARTVLPNEAEFENVLAGYEMTARRPERPPPEAPLRRCQWPLPGTKSLKETAQCGAPTEPGETLCPEHRRLARKYAGLRNG